MKNSLKVKDHSVSNEVFELVYDQAYDMFRTSPQPSKEDLPKYYESLDYISHTATKRNFIEYLYHIVRSYAINKKVQLITSFNKGNTLLDIGCGTGDFLACAKRNNWNGIGIEPNKGARELAKNKIGNTIFDSDHLGKLEPHSFDVITLWHVLEHLPDLEEHLLRFKSLLKADGRLIIAVPNYKSYDANKYGSSWAAYDVPRHLWHFSQSSIDRLFKKIAMSVENIKPMKFDAYYVALLSEKYKTGTSNLFKAFYTGFLSNTKAKKTNEYSSLIYIIKNDA
jgi:2-polyprenyl-3-methyl-5-hydroxy-6-metoxy-1,4-benzoquinol methylase